MSTKHDADMIRHASVRGFVRLHTGQRVTLIAWRPKWGRNRARVVDDFGGQFTVPVTYITEAIDLQIGR